MIAAERYLQAVFNCHHQPDGACADCMVAALIAHAEAVREVAATVAGAHFIPGHNVAGLRFAAACAIRIRAIEVK